MNNHQSHSIDTTNEIPYHSKRMVKRDFWLLPMFFIGIPLVIALIMLPINMVFVSQNHHVMALVNVISSVFAQIVFLLVFYMMHRKYIVPLAKQRIKQIKRYIKVLILTYLAMAVAQGVYGGLMTLLPKHLQFDNTQNQLIILKMFEFPIAWPVLFIDIVILTPIIEELVFRHVIIHELGKKIGYTAGAVLSVLAFAGVHVINASSPFEFGVYLIMACALVFVYMYSKRNLAVSITFHMMINGMGFIGIVSQYLLK